MANLDLSIPTIDLPDGNPIPILGYGLGTAWYKPEPGSVDDKLVEATKMAVRLGYHHLDGAEVYNTEPEQGKAIKDCGVPREKLYVVTKVTNITSNIQEHFDASLKKLGVDHVDLYLLHSPFDANGDKRIIQQAWTVMENILASGKSKSIGVSNFYREHLDALLETCKVRPAINQIEYHPYLQHGSLVEFMKNQNIRISAYGPQVPVVHASQGPLTPVLDNLAKKYAVNPGEILLRWVLDQGIVALTTSSKEQRLSDMLRSVTFKLTPKEQEEITEVGKSYHFRKFWTHIFSENDKS